MACQSLGVPNWLPIEQRMQHLTTPVLLAPAALNRSTSSQHFWFIGQHWLAFNCTVHKQVVLVNQLWQTTAENATVQMRHPQCR